MIAVFKGFLATFKENGVAIKTIVRRGDTNNNVLLEIEGGPVFLVDGGRSVVDSMHDFLLIKDMIDMCQFGSKQSGIEGNMIKVKKEKTKIDKKKLLELSFDKSIQKGIDDAWN